MHPRSLRVGHPPHLLQLRHFVPPTKTTRAAHSARPTPALSSSALHFAFCATVIVPWLSLARCSTTCTSACHWSPVGGLALTFSLIPYPPGPRTNTSASPRPSTP